MKTHIGSISISRTIGSLFTLFIILLGTACASSFPKSPASELPSEQAGQPVLTPTNERLPENEKPGEALLFERKGGDTFQIVQVSLDSGKPVEGVKTLEIGSEINYAFSPDRSRLAIASNGAGCLKICLRILQLDNLDELLKVELPLKDLNGNFAQQLVFDPQGKRIAIAMIEQGKTHLAIVNLSRPSSDLIQGDELAVYPHKIAFTGDGKQIMVLGSISPKNGATPPGNNPHLQALLLDVPTLSEEWRQDLPDIKDGFYGSEDDSRPEENYFYQAGYAVDPAKRRVYIAHADEERLTTVDFDQRTTATVVIRQKRSAIDQLVEFILSIGVHSVQAKAANMYMRSVLLSPDGQSLYVGGEQMNRVKDGNQWKMNTAYYGLNAWDIRGGTKLFHVDTNSFDILWGTEGKILLTGYDPNLSSYHPFTDIFDPSLGQITAHLKDFKAVNTLATNGQTAVVSSYMDDRGRTILGILDEQNENSALRWTQDLGAPMWLEFR